MDIFKSVKSWAILGGIAGAATEMLFYAIGKMNFNVLVGVPYSSISLERTGAASTVAQKILAPLSINFASSNLIMSMLIAALFGAIFTVLGGVIYDAIGDSLPGKGKAIKMMYVLLFAGIVGGWIVAGQLAVPALSVIIAMGISAAIVGYVIGMAGEKYIP